MMFLILAQAEGAVCLVAAVLFLQMCHTAPDQIAGDPIQLPASPDPITVPDVGERVLENAGVLDQSLIAGGDRHRLA